MEVRILRKEAEECLNFLKSSGHASVSYGNGDGTFQAKRFSNGRIELSIHWFNRTRNEWEELSAVMGSHASDLDKLNNVIWEG